MSPTAATDSGPQPLNPPLPLSHTAPIPKIQPTVLVSSTVDTTSYPAPENSTGENASSVTVQTAPALTTSHSNPIPPGDTNPTTGNDPSADNNSGPNIPEGSTQREKNLDSASNQPSPTAAQSTPPPDNNATPTANTNLTILKSDDVSIRVIKMTQGYKTKPSWQNYQDLWKALCSLVQFRVQSMTNVEPHQPNFHFQRAACSYASWIRTISNMC